MAASPPNITISGVNVSTHSVRFVALCLLWYTSSAMSSNTGKQIMLQFRFPVTLTFVQFAFVAGYCLVCASPVVPLTKIRSPTAPILRNTFPMALFQVGGHIFSSMAISHVPVSTVHTIKALSPLFTVAAYALLFGVSYSGRTYMSLLPLTFGVILACSFDVTPTNVFGLLCAFGSALVFVSSNIFFKKIMPTPNLQGRETSMHKLDKINLLFYSSGMAFLLMVPLWALTDLPVLLSRTADHGSGGGVSYYFLINGTVHFGQNILAFSLLQSTSPVTYSIASLIKRVAVIVLAIIWFHQSVHPIQAIGIAMTFMGLWMYHGAKGDVEKGERKARAAVAKAEGLLPLTKEEGKLFQNPSGRSTPVPVLSVHPLPPKSQEVQVYPSPPHSPPAHNVQGSSYAYPPPIRMQHRRLTHPNLSSSSTPIAVL